MKKQPKEPQKESLSEENSLESLPASVYLAQANLAYEARNWEKINENLESYLTKVENPTPEEKQQALTLGLAILLESDFNQRWELAKYFRKIGVEAIAPLVSVAEDENHLSEIRWFACRLLGEFDQQEVILSLVRIVENTEEEDVAQAASQALANIGSNSIQVLTDLLKKDSSRLKGVQALAKISQSSVVEPLLSVVGDHDPEVRALALEALGSFHQPQITKALIQALKDPSAKIRKEAVISLARSSDLPVEDLVWAIKPLLYDFNVEVSIQAGLALGRLGTKEAAAALYDVIISSATPTALQVRLLKSFVLSENIESLLYLEKILKKSETPIAIEIITVLGRVEEPHLKIKATEILLEFFTNQSPTLKNIEIKQSLANSLGQLGQFRAMGVLARLGEDLEPRVKLHAQAALKKLSVAMDVSNGTN